MMTLLIHKNDLANYFQIAPNISEQELNTYILQAQEFELKQNLPLALFVELIEDPHEEKFSLLLNGGIYTYKGEKFHFLGLKACLCFWAYAYFVVQNHQNSTPFGLVQKQMTHSKDISQEQKRDLQKQLQQNAGVLFQQVEQYLKRSDIFCNYYKADNPLKHFKISVL